MEIIQKTVEDGIQLRLEGRLDAYSAEHLTGTIQQLAREGQRQVSLEMSALVFLSSAGIRSLLKGAREMRTIGGAMTIVNPSAAVLEVLELARLEMLVASAPAPMAESDAPRATPAPGPGPAGAGRVEAAQQAPAAGPVRSGVHEGISYRVVDDRPEKTLAGVLHGDAGKVGKGLFGAGDCRVVEFPERVTGLGLAALGDGFEECRGRFGEFLAAGGAFAYQATDLGQRADYVVTTGQLVPRSQLLYGLEAQGDMSVALGFEGDEGPVKLSALAGLAIKEAGSAGDPVVFVAIAEVQGLVGVSLKKSLALAVDPAEPVRYPGVRDWMNFTTEPVHTESVALVVGVALAESAVAGSVLGPFVRVLAPGVAGHVHAAAFSYKPLRKDVTRLPSAVSQLFEGQSLKGVMHLLNDTRPISGSGESLFVRGTLWAGRLTQIKTQGSNP